MGDEAEEATKAAETGLTNMLFAHAYMERNPQLFNSMYPEFFGPPKLSDEEEASLEWEIPQDEHHAAAMLADLREVGVPV